MNEQYKALYEKLSTLQWLLQRYRMENYQRNGPFGDPTRGQGRLLMLLKNQSGMTTKDLVYVLGIRQQSLNDLIKKMENAGLVERVPSEKDKRVLIVRLTEKGKNSQTAEVDYSGLFVDFSEEELEQFSEYLDRMIAALGKEYGSPVDEETYKWIEDFRGRMPEEDFEKMMSMRRRMPGGFGFDRERGGMFGRDGRDRRDRGPFDEEWGEDFRGRMPEEDVERRMSMGRRGMPGGFGFDREGRGMPGRDGRGPRSRKGDRMPEAERFDPSYTGPVPEGRMDAPFGWSREKEDEKGPDEKE